MFKFFSFKKKQKNDIDSTLLVKLDRLIELLEQQSADTNKNFRFEHVQINRLENIVFHLDNLEIDQLSGKLIIGNNIHSDEDTLKPLMENINKEKGKEAAKSEVESNDQPNFTQTNKGYRFRNH